MICKARLLVLVVLATGSSSGLRHTGDITYYKSWYNNLGSCGLHRSMKDPYYVAALSKFYMRNPPHGNPNLHPLCKPDQCVQIFGHKGTAVVLKISDTCGGCADYNVDIADTIFPKLDDPAKGRVKMSWQFVNCQHHPPGVQSLKSSFESWILRFRASYAMSVDQKYL